MMLCLGILKFWAVHGRFMWKCSSGVGDVSLGLGQKFRARDVDLVIIRKTAENKAVGEIAKGEQGCWRWNLVWLRLGLRNRFEEELLSNFAHLVFVSSVPQSEKCACYVSNILLPQRSVRRWLAFKKLIFIVGKPTYGQILINTN